MPKNNEEEAQEETGPQIIPFVLSDTEPVTPAPAVPGNEIEGDSGTVEKDSEVTTENPSPKDDGNS